jgi:hypothetical protein
LRCVLWGAGEDHVRNCQPLARQACLTWLGLKVRIGRVVPVPWMVRPFAYVRLPRLTVSSLRSWPAERSRTRTWGLAALVLAVVALAQVMVLAEIDMVGRCVIM